ncbi:MAG: GAF domain-containing protein [Candidatus Xenobium sp.]|jgi:GAF domain-containing protein|nr:GAF domain-containing protein [Burkholderiales bacterium]
MQMDIPLRALEILLQGRRLNRSALSRAQRESQSSGRPLEQILLEAGEFDRETWLEAASQAAGVPGFNLQSQKVSASWAQTITREVAEQIPALPVARQEGQLVVVLQDPTDTFALERLSTLTKHPISPRVTYNPDLPGAIEKAFSVRIDRIGADTPHQATESQRARSGMRFATATRTPNIDRKLQLSMVKNMGVSRSVKIDGFVAASPIDEAEQAETPHEKMELLARNLMGITEPGDLRQRLDAILRSARLVCRSDGASVLRLSEDRTELYFAHAVGSRTEELMKIRLPLDERSVAGFSILRRQTLRVSDAAIDPRQSKKTDQQIGYQTRSLVAAPIFWEGEPLGVLEVVNKIQGSFDDDDVEFMQVLATQSAVAIRLSQLAEQAASFRQEAIAVFQDLLERSRVQSRARGELVARVGLALGQELGLSTAELERLNLAARVHELDRLGADAPQELLARIRALADVAAVVGQLRAPFAREGKPDPAVPRLSRILALAVAWIEGLERTGLSGRQQLLREILQDCGSRFDPALKIPFEIAVNAVTPPG